MIKVSGPDAEKFLQGQLTCDVREVTEMQSRLGAHCDHKGRVQFTFRLFYFQNDYYLQLPERMVQLALSHLQKYAIFSKVKLEEVTQGPEGIASEINPLQDIFDGVAAIYPETVGEFTPHQLNYPAVGGVSFNKGCYTGQEIVARSEYLGKQKQHLYQVSLQAEKIPHPGTVVFDKNGEEVGKLVMAAKEKDTIYALVVLRNTVLNKEIFIDGNAVNLFRGEYLGDQYVFKKY